MKEAVFKNGLVLREDCQAQTVTALIVQDGREHVVGSSSQASLTLPKAGESAPCVVIHNPQFKESISTEGALQISFADSHRGAPTSQLEVQPDGKVVGEFVHQMPANCDKFIGEPANDEIARQNGNHGFYSDDVQNHYYFSKVAGTLEPDGTLNIMQNPADNPRVLVTPGLLGNPQPAHPLPSNGSWHARYEFTPDGNLNMTSMGAGVLGMQYAGYLAHKQHGGPPTNTASLPAGKLDWQAFQADEQDYSDKYAERQRELEASLAPKIDWETPPDIGILNVLHLKKVKVKYLEE